MRAAITGIGKYLPDTVVTNESLARVLDTSDEWIRTRTGIRQRHVISPGQVTSDLAIAASQRALAAAKKEQVDMVLVATTTPDQVCPAMAPVIADALGMSGQRHADLLSNLKNELR